MADVLVCSYLGDIHTDAVLWGLNQRGQSTIHWRPSEYPAHQALSIEFGLDKPNRHLIESVDGPVILDEVKTVWNRRPRSPQTSSDLDPRDKDFAQTQSERHLEGFLSTVCAGALWVNAPAVASREFNKPYQLRLAQEVGLRIPPTMISNSPDEIWKFYERHQGNLIYKPYKGGKWTREGKKFSIFVNYTSDVTREDALDRQALSFAPGIFQVRLPKAFEVRVTIIGRSLFCARIELPENEHGRLDWRTQGKEIQLSPTALPSKVATSCHSFMEKAGMMFGCFDFVVSPEMEYYFLEVNQMGQFLWKEEILPDLPLLDAMCSFLDSGDPSFVWQPGAQRLAFQDYMGSDAYAQFRARAIESQNRPLAEAAQA